MKILWYLWNKKGNNNDKANEREMCGRKNREWVGDNVNFEWERIRANKTYSRCCK